MKPNTILFALMAMSATMAMASPHRAPVETVKRCDNDQCDNRYDNQYDDQYNNQNDDQYNNQDQDQSGEPNGVNSPIVVPYHDGKPCGFGPYNYGPNGFDSSHSSGPVPGVDFVNHRQHDVRCPDGYSHDSSNSQCCYDAYGNLAYAKDGCPGEVVPPEGQPKKAFACDTKGGDSDNLLGSFNILNCIDICVLSRHCPKKKTCRARGGNGNGILGITALNCDNLNLLGMNLIGG